MKQYMIQWYGSDSYKHAPCKSMVCAMHHECNFGMVKKKAFEGCDVFTNYYYSIFDLDGFKLIETTLPIEVLDCL